MKSIEIDGAIIAYDDELAKGVYRVSDPKTVDANCSALRIEIHTPDNENEVSNKVSKIDDYGILTSCGANNSFQFIFNSLAKQSDVDELIKAMPKQAHELLRSAYQMSKPIRLNDLGSFLKAFGKS